MPSVVKFRRPAAKKIVRKPVSSTLHPDDYRMLKVLAAYEDKNLGQMIEQAVVEMIANRKHRFTSR